MIYKYEVKNSEECKMLEEKTSKLEACFFLKMEKGAYLMAMDCGRTSLDNEDGRFVKIFPAESYGRIESISSREPTGKGIIGKMNPEEVKIEIGKDVYSIFYNPISRE